jgi:integrase
MPRKVSPPRLYFRKRKNGAGVWIILDRGLQISTGALESDRDAAHAALADYLNRTHRPGFGKGHPDQVQIADALAEYAQKHAPTTIQPEHVGYALAPLGAFFSDQTCAAINENACKKYVAWRCAQTDARAKKSEGRAITASTARRELAVLSAALRWCHRHGKLDRIIPIKLPGTPAPRERHLVRGEAARLLAAALGFHQVDGRWRRRRDRINRHLARFILTGLYTGTRHTAILQLQWSRNTAGGHVDLAAGVIHRRAARAVESGKRRTPLPIPPRLLPHLRRWQRHSARYLVEWNGRPVKHVRTAWDKTRQAAGLDAEVTAHVLRHTCATWLLQAGVSIYDVAGILGCSEKVVRDTYGHHAHDHLRQAVAAFSRPRPAQ